MDAQLEVAMSRRTSRVSRDSESVLESRDVQSRRTLSPRPSSSGRKVLLLSLLALLLACSLPNGALASPVRCFNICTRSENALLCRKCRYREPMRFGKRVVPSGPEGLGPMANGSPMRGSRPSEEELFYSPMALEGPPMPIEDETPVSSEAFGVEVTSPRAPTTNDAEHPKKRRHSAIGTLVSDDDGGLASATERSRAVWSQLPQMRARESNRRLSALLAELGTLFGKAPRTPRRLYRQTQMKQWM